ncbi:MAG: nif-specific transcriptional activator NifA [Nitrospinae bacterium]|nr:nif-specific transcriptional activator NifA [Nitrospinota bacterium]
MSDLSDRSMEAVYQVSHCLAKSAKPQDTLKKILAILASVMDYRLGTVTLVDPESGDLLVEAAHAIKEENLKDVRYHKGEGITGVVLESGLPLAIPALKNDPRFLNRPAVYNPDSAFLGVPILEHKSIRGVFSFSVDGGERYRLDEHLRIATIFANLIGGVLSRYYLMEKEKEIISMEKDRLEGQLKGRYQPENMVGVSKAMRYIFENIGQVSRWNTTVLIRGESGTGKELVAKAIHFQSPRAGGPLIKLNCAALPETLLESELFGYEKGAFTGAEFRKPGRFELAHKGTLFLDEIGDASLSMQTKLLRVLQEGQFERVGGTETIKVDVRLIAATNVDLEKAVSEKRFREDFYYRLNVMPIYLPPLRERKEDVPYLAEFFLEKLSKEVGAVFTMDAESLGILQGCDFPGNIRELENCVHRAAITARDHGIRAEDIPCTRSQCYGRLIHLEAEKPAAREAEGDIRAIPNERERVLAALKKSGWVQAKAARLLDMTPRQMGYRVQKLNIKLETF